jgi:cyanophycinase
MIDGARGCTDCAATVDVVVLRTSGSDGYNSFVAAMPGVDSVETLLVTQPTDSDVAKVATILDKAEVVFFAGGDQCTYVDTFAGNAIEAAVHRVFARGGAIGGTSAGMAIQGAVVYDGCVASARSAQALADPYHRSVTFQPGLFAWPHLEHVVTDTHFAERDRMGRLMTFLARQLEDGKTPEAIGLAAEEGTSIGLRDGTATVLGEGHATVVVAAHAPERCEGKNPLTYSNFRIWRLSDGDTFDLSARPTDGYRLVSVVDGVLSADPYPER